MDTMDEILSFDNESIDLEMNSQDGDTEKKPMGTLSAVTAYIKSHRAIEIVVCLAFFLLTNILQLFKFDVYRRPMPVQYLPASNEYVKNLTNNETFESETVPHELLIFLSGVLPLAVQLALSLVCRWSSAPINEVHRTLCVYLLAWSLNMIACDFVKSYVGYLRPIFFQLCEPNEDHTMCTGESVDSLRRSFPSGHASTAFCGTTMLALYVHTRFGLRSKKASNSKAMDTSSLDLQETKKDDEEDTSHAVARLFSVVALAPMFVALWIASSRVRDNKHFPADILGGALLGASLANYCHGLWFDYE